MRHRQKGGYVASVPALPGCVSQGETFEETKENIKDAISGYLAVLREDQEEIPTEETERWNGSVLFLGVRPAVI